MTRTYHAPAKINLWLRVFQGDPTGYHPLDTLFCAIDLSDRIEIGRGDGIELGVTGADVGPNENNLAYRAAFEYHHALDLEPNVRIKLHKVIPSGAGLGGGSSDAATVLRALQDIHDKRLPEPDLLALAARIGSDVPFFLCGSHLAHATGRGELLTALPSLPARDVLVLMPAFSITTRDAYGWLDERGGADPGGVPRAHPANWEDVARAAVNDFEPVLFHRFPQLEALRNALQDSGAEIALLSGSGSALFGIFENEKAAATARETLADRFNDVAIHSARTLE